MKKQMEAASGAEREGAGASAAGEERRAGRIGWTPPTRRRFLGLVLAAGAVAAAPAVKEAATATVGRKTRWIGHC